jgi:hypothetical protein
MVSTGYELWIPFFIQQVVCQGRLAHEDPHSLCVSPCNTPLIVARLDVVHLVLGIALWSYNPNFQKYIVVYIIIYYYIVLYIIIYYYLLIYIIMYCSLFLYIIVYYCILLYIIISYYKLLYNIIYYYILSYIIMY